MNPIVRVASHRIITRRKIAIQVVNRCIQTGADLHQQLASVAYIQFIDAIENLCMRLHQSDELQVFT